MPELTESMKPLAIDLYAGLGGWAEGFLAEGYDVVGFDVEEHKYWVTEVLPDHDGLKGTKPVEKRGWTQGCAVSLGLEGATARPRTRLLSYPGQLVLQDVLTLHGSQFRNAAVIVASPPCQAYSYRAMPWKRAKALPPPDNALFDACFRIQREASEAAGRHIPLIVENVKGAQPWVGRAAWHYGSYYLWGDVPALMPPTLSKRQKFPANCSPRMWCDREVRVGDGLEHAFHQKLPDSTKNSKTPGGTWFGIQSNGKRYPGQPGNPVSGVKVSGDWFGSYAEQKAAGTISPGRRHGKNSIARKAASAQIAKIPFELAAHIARVFKPAEEQP